ncbi:heavy-metal-associated domain-containing protein [Allomuricauda sp. R78024]|uniref:heavy-metal-associated domain-containing protein n=1 Tax=Allomuricauda sp. R78024 TaxID=3093867 RepID=UPI0037C5DBDD
MKKNLLFTVLFIVYITNSFAQEKNKNLVLDVKGNCGMCKARIEKACQKMKGVKFASWDIASKKLSLVLDEAKCSPLEVKKIIASVGHDTDETKANLDTYEKLPACCKYRDPNSINMDHSGKH